MYVGFHSSVSGMMAYQKELDTLAHNIANVNTFGYKAMRTSFSDLMYTKMDTNVEGNHLTGHGVKNANMDLLFTQGNLNSTQRPLDFAIVGDGFFAVEMADGTTKYTRDGAFHLSVEDDTLFLVNGEGGYVLDANGDRIEVPFEDGTNNPDYFAITDSIGIYSFSNPFGLIPTNGGFYQSANSGEAVAVNEDENANYTLLQNTVEFSSVDLAREMADVITTQKAFQFNARMVQMGDQLEEIVNTLR